ncbi:MAG: cobalamin-dependent protein, partial [Kiloniellales bacterium]
RTQVQAVSKGLGARLKLLIGKPGLDGHSNGAEPIALRARDAGIDLVYQGIRFTAAEIVAAARAEGVHVVGLSVLSGSHVPLVREVLAGLKEAGLDGVPVVVGGIIPPDDAEALREAGVAAIFTPKDYELNAILTRIVELAAKAAERAA